MQHPRDIENKLASDDEPDRAARHPLRSADRSVPRGMGVLNTAFTFATLICFFSVPLVGLFLERIVGRSAEFGMLPILMSLGALVISAGVLLNYAHIRALAGYRQIRERQSETAQAVFAFMVFVSISALHPFAGLGIPAGLLLAGLTLLLFQKRHIHEPLWDLLPNEAVSIAAGRDFAGVSLSSGSPEKDKLPGGILLVGATSSALMAIAISSDLSAQNILSPNAILPNTLTSVLATCIALPFLGRCFQSIPADVQTETEVSGFESETEQNTLMGLNLQNLSVRNASGHLLLSDISLQFEQGQITGLIGESGAGKTLLLQAIADPYSLGAMQVSGNVRMNGRDLWSRSPRSLETPVVYLPASPIMLPASGADNLTGFQVGQHLERGKHILEQLVYSADLVDTICAVQDATRLPAMQSRALALSRGFLISPYLYLFDRPEDGLAEKQIGAVIERLKQEIRLGRSALLVTDNRKLLEICDRLVVLQEGRIVDYGDADQVRDRIATGWSRFIGTRELESEENLLRWVKSHFRRGPEDANKRRVCRVASDMLTLSCQTADRAASGYVHFTFKHFKGYCVLRLEDGDPPFSSAQLDLARNQSQKDLKAHKTPLAAIFENTLEQSAGSQLENRTLEVKIETFDPRNVKPERQNERSEA